MPAAAVAVLLTANDPVGRVFAQDEASSKGPKRTTTERASQSKAESPGTDELIKLGRTDVERFFGEPYRAPFEVKVFPDRAGLTEFARKRWGFEKTECWMVAMGVSSMVVVLSPDVWKTQACEHEPSAAHVREILTHELVHVFHGQHNPSDEFNGMDDAGWFVEGLAIHAAGQLTEPRMSRFCKALKAGRSPARLADAWSGEHRYAQAGSLVRYIEERWGREKLKKLLGATTNAEILKALGVTEKELLVAWRASVLKMCTSSKSNQEPVRESTAPRPQR